MRRGCITQSQLICSKCGGEINVPSRYLVIDEDDKVFPMVPGGKPLSDVFDEKDYNKKG